MRTLIGGPRTTLRSPLALPRLLRQAACVTVSCLFVVALFCALEPRAYAYVDPGSGLLLYQGVSAMFAGVFFHFRRRLKALVASTASSAESEKQPAAPEPVVSLR